MSGDAILNLNPPRPSARAVQDALAAPFDPHSIKWLPKTVSGGRALAIAYVDARVIQERLDDVVGAENWQDEYQVLQDGSVICQLRIRIGDEWITKCDVGSLSEQPDAGDKLKAAFSDALKRAAVKFGISRYLYRLSAEWADYDTKTRRITNPPRLPPWALPHQQAPRPVPSAAEGDPVHSFEALDLILKRKGKTFGRAIEWLNHEYERDYTAATAWHEIPPGLRQDVVKVLLGMPDAKGGGS